MKVKGRKRLSKAIAVFMTVFMLMGMMPQMAFADEPVSAQQVRVVVENSIWTEDNGAPWSGTLADESVDITDDTTLISAINAALQKAGQQKLSDSTQHITDVNGIADGDAGEDCKWKVTINDAAALNALSDYTVAAGKIKNGDVVKVSYEGNVTATSQPQEQETSAGGQQGDGASNTEESGEESDEGDQAKAGDTDSDKSREAKSAEQVAAKATAFAAMFSSVSAANTGNAVRVIVENTVYSKTDGAPWDGRLVDEWVEINEESTMMSCVVAALDKHNYSQTGAESNYITKINGLTAGSVESANYFDGWMGTLNDWFTSEGFGMYTVADGTLEAGDEIKIMYSLDMGEDIGGSWNNNEKTLKSLTFSSGSLDNTFDKNTKAYTLTIPKGTESIKVTPTATNKNFLVKTFVGEKEYKRTAAIPVSDGTVIKVICGDPSWPSMNGGDSPAETYTVTVKLNKVDSIGAFFKVSPEDAVVKVYDQEGMSIYPDETGVFKGMFAAQEYTYVVTKYGYVAKSGKVPAAGGMIKVTLEKAPDDGLKDVDSDWKNFRGSDENMGITDAKTPVSKDDTSKLWNAKLGSDWSAAPSVQIIVDDALIVMSGKELFKLDLETGEILKKGTMTAAPNFGYTPPTYAEGMIFCPLTGGTIQAFNAETLESLWIYKDSNGGQSLSPITYSEGYIYTGFWNSEVKDANYVCLSVTDEDPTKPDEAKLATWKQGQQGGFYWAGSVAVGNAVIFGTDDGAGGTAGDSMLYSLDKKTGNVISSIELKGMGDQRSSMAYDKNSGRVFFTTKGGFLCSAAVNASTGQLSDLKSVDHNAQSTSTPIVYKGKVYFATGSGISSTGSSGNIVVADAKNLEMLYAVGLKGYPQCSLLMSTAYEEETGYIYIYSTYNNRPGGISMLKVKPDAMTAAEAELIELYDAEGFEQFCITSIICGKDGTLYYKNDSGNVFAIGVPDVTVVKNLIDKIGEPQSITLDSRYDIEDAREAYEALDETEKTEVPNYDNLVAAENRLNELQIENVEALIDDIGTVTLSGEEKINAARAAYDALTDEQKAEVSNYDKLTEAEKTLKKLKEEQAAAAEQQNKPAKENNTSSTKVVTKSANIKLTEEKVTEEQLEKGRENHYDSATGIDVSGNSNDILPWYVKMTVEEKSLTKKQESEVKKALGEDCKIFMFKDIHFTDTNTGEEWQPGEPIKVRMPAVDMEGYKNLVIIHISDDGKIELINAEVKNGMIEFEATGFSLYGIAGTNTSIDKMMAPEAEEPVVWPWILIGAIALVIIAIIAIRKKSARE